MISLGVIGFYFVKLISNKVHTLFTRTSIGLGSILLFIVGYWGYLTAIRWKLNQQKASNFKRNGGLLLKKRNSSEHGMTENNLLFTADELDKATDHFNENRILGRGGQGTVFKGMMTDGSLVAIKMHKLGDQTQLEEFINEIAILSGINHRNIVRLLGCCLETDVPLLVYEFIVNGALSKYLHHPQNDYPITWHMRLQIALDVASAIYHLRSTSSSPIFHKDIKTDNILLDEKYRAKLSDFGTSRSISIDKSHLTTQVKGTFGYLDLEYHRTGQYNEKSDVFSFGVVIIELLTGKKAVYQTESGGRENLVLSFQEATENSAFQDMLAPEVVNEASVETIAATVLRPG
ncbi:wall-associated receptor kinase-like 1 [Silene latifolia]|uniref:wall-associated receptor kinase-like 1 n=1 Tax=Silene latifolia TaxID=37657 RepID=UPI003D76D963